MENKTLFNFDNQSVSLLEKSKEELEQQLDIEMKKCLESEVKSEKSFQTITEIFNGIITIDKYLKKLKGGFNLER